MNLLVNLNLTKYEKIIFATLRPGLASQWTCEICRHAWIFPVIDRRYGHTTPTMATGASASVVAIVGVVFTGIGKTNLLDFFFNAF